MAPTRMARGHFFVGPSEMQWLLECLAKLRRSASLVIVQIDTRRGDGGVPEVVTNAHQVSTVGQCMSGVGVS